MADIPGKEVLLYQGDGGSPESFGLIAAGTSHSITITNTEVDKNSKDSGGYREVFPEGSIKSCQISMTGIYTETAEQESLRNKVNGDPPKANYRFYLGGSRMIEGEFQVTSYEHSGETEGFAQFTAQFTSNGVFSDVATP